MVAYVGEDKLISKVSRTDVQFHAMRAAQELSYDVLRSIKSQEIEVPPSFVNNEPIVFSTEYIMERRELLIIQSSDVNSSFLENNLWTPLFMLKNIVQN